MKVRKGIILWCGVATLLFCLASCRVKRPDFVLSDAKMEAVLYDYHIAKAMGEQLSYNESYKRVLYLESVFRKHGITEAQFDTSMVWLSRNPSVLRDIYEHVNERLKAEKKQVENLIALRDNKPRPSLPGDSIDVWAWERVYRLTGMPLDNLISFDLPSDINFKDCDTLRWNVRFRFIGGKDQTAGDTLFSPVMALQVFYANDSLLHEVRRVDRSGMETLSLSADTLGKIERICGFVYYPRQSSGRILLADSVSLMRYHARTDSARTITPVSASEAGARPVQARPLSRSRIKSAS